MTIQTERLTIQKLRREDAPAVIRIHAVPSVKRFQDWVPDSQDEIDTLVDCMTRSEFLAPDQWFQFSIARKEDRRRLIGDCGVRAGARDRRQVEVGVTIDPAFQRQGYAREAIDGLLGFLFQQTDTHRIYASIDPRNVASIRLFDGLGFRKEAHLVQSLWFKGEWADDLIMAVLRCEWIMLNQAREAVEVDAQDEQRLEQ